MHDTSTQSMSRWKAVGAKRNESSILSPTLNLEPRRESRKYRPSKQKELSNSKFFNRNKSRVGLDSLDNIPKQDLNDSAIKESAGPKTRRLTKNSEDMNVPIVRVSSESTLMANPKEVNPLEGTKQRRNSGFGTEKQLIVLKEDYNRFKQKILNELQLQKQNIQNMVNEILQTVRTQLLAIQEKYSTAYSNGKKEHQIMPSIQAVSAINLPKMNGVGVKFKLGEGHNGNNGVSQVSLQRTQSEKAIINELTSVTGVEEDQITSRFSKFYSAIQKIKSDLDCLSEITAANKQGSEVNVSGGHGSHVTHYNTGVHSRQSSILKT